MDCKVKLRRFSPLESLIYLVRDGLAFSWASERRVIEWRHRMWNIGRSFFLENYFKNILLKTWTLMRWPFNDDEMIGNTLHWFYINQINVIMRFGAFSEAQYFGCNSRNLTTNDLISFSKVIVEHKRSMLLWLVAKAKRTNSFWM